MTELATVFTAVEGNIISFIPCVGKPQGEPFSAGKMEAKCNLRIDKCNLH